MALFCYTVALTALTKEETLVFQLRAVPKKLRALRLSVKFKTQIFLPTPRWAA
jgi:hypothetical protein